MALHGIEERYFCIGPSKLRILRSKLWLKLATDQFLASLLQTIGVACVLWDTPNLLKEIAWRYISMAMKDKSSMGLNTFV